VIRTALLGLALGAVAVCLWGLPVVEDLERSVELPWLFRARGPRPEPTGTAVVALDRAASLALGYGERPSDWSRRSHAELIRRLEAAGVAAIVFDIAFVTAKDPAADAALAASLTGTDNVVLAEALRRDWIDGGATRVFRVSRETFEDPLAPLAAQAIDMAPFPLPKEAPNVDYWQWYRPTAGDVATLPAVALAVAAHPQYEVLRALWRAAGGSTLPEWRAGNRPLQRTLATLREGLQAVPELADRLEAGIAASSALDARGRAVLRHLLALAGSPPDRLIDHYGPPRTIRTLSFHRALSDEAGEALRGRVVFVGYSADAQSGQDVIRDNYPTPYPGPDGLEQSGVEVAAAAFANLDEGRALRRCETGAAIAFLVAWGVLCMVVLASGHIRVIWPTAAVLGALWGGAAVWWFAARQVWVPLLVPEIELAAAAAAASAVRVGLVRRAIRYFVPDRVADRLSDRSGRPEVGRTDVDGVVLISDAEGYTSVVERLPRDRVSAVVRAYQETLAGAVEGQGGSVVDWAGDGMLAMWEYAGADRARAAAAAAVAAALDAVDATLGPGRDVQGVSLPTRVGLHAGSLSMDLVGGGRRYAYRPIGDVVNTAARLQELNKAFHTRVLVSGAVAEALTGFVTRNLGEIDLRGKSERLTVYEIVAAEQGATPAQRRLCSEFADAMSRFRGGDVRGALSCLERISEAYPDDGPTRVFLERWRASARGAA
jgi:adenylate cyclase